MREPVFRLHDYILSLRHANRLRICRIDPETEAQDKWRNFHMIRSALLRASINAERDDTEDDEIPYPFTLKLTPSEMMAAVLRVNEPPEVCGQLQCTRDGSLAYLSAVLEVIEESIAAEYAYRYVPHDIRMN